MGVSSTSSPQYVPRCYNTDGSPVFVQANTVVTTPWYPEGIYQPSPAQGAANWQKNLAQNINPNQQPGLL